MRRLWLRLMLLIASFGMACTASADELKWTHFGVRPLAMGNAYVAVADDYNALFYNPAGLARLKSWDGELLNPSAEISASTLDFISDASKLASGSSGNTDAVLDLLEKNTGKIHHFALGWTPHLIFPGFGFGLGGELAGTLAIHRDISTDVDVGPRLIAPIAFAKNFFEERLSLGLGVKLVARGGIDRNFSINDIQAFSKKKADDAAGTTNTGPELKDFVEGGMGYGVDLGMLFTPTKTMEPTLGISITDVGGTPYNKVDIAGKALGTPAPRLPSVNTGFSMKPIQTSGMYVRTSVDAHAINHPVHYSKKFNLGAEWGLGSILKLQTGLHQGEMTGGFEFDLFLLTLRFATYTEQLGTASGQDNDLKDRRYAMQLKLLI